MALTFHYFTNYCFPGDGRTDESFWQSLRTHQPTHWASRPDDTSLLNRLPFPRVCGSRRTGAPEGHVGQIIDIYRNYTALIKTARTAVIVWLTLASRVPETNVVYSDLCLESNSTTSLCYSQNNNKKSSRSLWTDSTVWLSLLHGNRDKTREMYLPTSFRGRNGPK